MTACLTPLLTPLEDVLVGVCFGLLPGVLLGRWSLLLHRPPRKRVLPPPARLPHAGHLVQRGSVAAGPLDTPGKRQFRQVR